MSYEANKSFMIQFMTKNTFDPQTNEVIKQGEIINKIIDIPDRFVMLMDFPNNFGEIIIKHNSDLSDLENIKDIDFICVTMTNDPYCEFSGGIVNLGSYCIRWRLMNGALISTNPLIFKTDFLDGCIFSETIPLRIPNKVNGDIGTRFVNNSENTYQVLDYKFGDSHDKDFHLKYSCYDYDEKTAKSIYRIQNIMSAYNLCELREEKVQKSVENMLNYHRLLYK